VLFAAVHGNPVGLFVVTVIVIFFPKSALVGVYEKENGDTVEEEGLTEPPPFSVIVTLVALPPNVFPETVTAAVPHVVPVLLERTNNGHCPRVFKEQHKIKHNMPAALFISNGKCH
jgi:hypothetical protein